MAAKKKAGAKPGAKPKARPCENTDAEYGCKGRGKIKATAHHSTAYCDKCRSPEERAKNTRKVSKYRGRLQDAAEEKARAGSRAKKSKAKARSKAKTKTKKKAKKRS